MADLKEIKIFISYANEDCSLLNDIKRYALGFKERQKIKIWDDGNITLGDRWNTEIRQNLIEADIVLLFITPDFLLSDYINNTEIKIALERDKKKLCKVITLFIRYCKLEELLKYLFFKAFLKESFLQN